MKCTNHPEIEAEGMCVYCGKPFCKDCLIDVKGKLYCKDDIGNVLDEAKQTGNSSQPTINITNTNDNANINSNMNGGYGLPAPKSKLVALLLCIFLGVGGFHRFYVGKIGSGLIYLFTFGLFGIGVIIDFIRILVGSFRDKYGQLLI